MRNKIGFKIHTSFFSRLVILLYILFFLLVSNNKVFASAPATNDLSDNTTYNVRLDGSAASEFAGFYSVQSADFDEDGLADLVIGTMSNYVFVIFGSTINTYSGSINLATATNYNIKYTNITVAVGAPQIADVNNDGKPDLIINDIYAANNSRGNSGSVYIIDNSKVRSYAASTANNVNITTDTNYSLRIDGASAGDLLGNALEAIGDVNNNDTPDFVVGGAWASNNGSHSGSLYVVTDSVIAAKYDIGTKNIDLATTSNYLVRFDGAAADDEFSSYRSYIADMNNDGNNDIVAGAYYASSNGKANSGSVYIIDNLIINSFEAGSSTNMASSTSYTIRIDGANVDEEIGKHALYVADLDNDENPDLLIGARYADYNGRTDSGSFYVIYNTILPYSGTGRTMDLSTDTNYNLRYEGAVAGDDFSAFNLQARGINYDGGSDIIVGAQLADNSSKSASGSIYIIPNSYFIGITGTGNKIDMADTNNYGVRYDGPMVTSILGGGFTTINDFNGDGRLDLVISGDQISYNGKTYSGSVYLIYNFPHSITLDSVSSTISTSTLSITGSVSATGSLTNIKGVEYQLDSGSWTACTASDGSFNSTSEDFSCGLSGYSSGAHTVYVRAYDDNYSYTSSTKYGSDNFTYTSTSASATTSSSSNSSSNNSSSSSCTNFPPSSAPLLYQIDASAKEATLYFVPASSPVDSYLISYGLDSNANSYSTPKFLGWTNGAIKYTINSLSPNTVYYLKVRGNNGCMPGEWSNTMIIKTTNNILTNAKFYPNSFIPNTTTKNVLITSNIQPIKQIVKSTTPPLPVSSLAPTKVSGVKDSTPQSNPKPSPKPSKQCFLFWCF